MHKLMEKESMSEWLMRDNHIPECNRSHRPEVGQVAKTYLPKLWIETGILHTTFLEHNQSSLIDDRWDEESFHSSTLF
jgi:hypothetical protein